MTSRVLPRKTSWTLLTAGMFLGGCAQFPHVELSAPTADAPLPERLEAYERLSPAPTLGPKVMRTDISHPAQLDLSDGTQVYWAEDLLPVVPEHSPTAKTARNVMRDQKTAKVLGITGSIAAVVGGIMFITPIFASGPPGGNGSQATTIVMTTGGALAIGGSIMSLVGRFKASKAARENAWAFGTYDEDLRRKLGVCRTKSGDVVDCAPSVARGSSP